MKITQSHLRSLGIATLFACALPVIAQDVGELVQTDAEVVPQGPSGQAEFTENRYRIGLDCSPSSPTLRSQLRLEQNSGLTVRMVMPNSPAEVAGLRPHDVIVEANGQTVGEVMDLVRQVNAAKDTEMSVTLIREGTQHQVKITPEERDEAEVQRLRDGFQQRLGQDFPEFGPLGGQAEWRELFKQFPDMNQFGNGTFRRVNPGFAIPRLPDVPNEFSLQIERHNDRITVQRGNDRYEVTTDTLDQLPDDIRPLVENMLNGGRFQMRGLFAPGMPRFAPGLPQLAPGMPQPDSGSPQLPPAPSAPSRPNQRIEDRFDGLELQLKQLQDAIRKFEEK